MVFNPQTEVNRANEHKDVVILFRPSLKSRQKHSQPCIFCGTTDRIQTFKGKAVCSSCYRHIPALFLRKQKRVQRV